MLTILEDLRSGDVSCIDVPSPELRPRGILVRTAFSAISSGTERAKLEQGEKSLVKKALARPDLVKQVLSVASSDGVKAAYNKVRSRLDTLSSMGYSCSGTVIAVGEGAERSFRVGDRVACGGVGYASHSEINFVPMNLAVRLPDQVSLDEASLTTIGAIAMQGVRQSGASLGETIAIIGAGLVGVLTIQLCKAAGCKVVAIDLNPERVAAAERMGAHLAISADGDVAATVKGFAAHGVDAVLLTAATRSSAPLELAAKIARDRGRVVVVGDVPVSVPRTDMYHKELSITMSRSYGPGRYDTSYEEQGNDYPIGYVRWTENRNMQAFVDLLAAGVLDLAPLMQHRYRIEDGGKAYEKIRSNGAYTSILQYSQAEDSPTSSPRPALARTSRPTVAMSGKLRVGCIGAGSFARGVIFPILQNLDRVHLAAVATASGASAESARRNFRFERAQSPEEILMEPSLDAIFVMSRHDTHANYVLRAIRNHKPVFVEKPLAVTKSELQEIRTVSEEETLNGREPFIMVGFNRRFAPFTRRIEQFFAGRREPMMVNIRVNAGYIPPQHWIQEPCSGGRVVGELCHFVDWARYVIGFPIRGVVTHSLPDYSKYCGDNLSATLSFQDGSIANLVYVANGDKSVPKEYFEVFCEGAVARMEDFANLELVRRGKKERLKATADKGHRIELEKCVAALLSGSSAPIELQQLLEVSETTLAIKNATSSNEVFPLSA